MVTLKDLWFNENVEKIIDKVGDGIIDAESLVQEMFLYMWNKQSNIFADSYVSNNYLEDEDEDENENENEEN